MCVFVSKCLVSVCCSTWCIWLFDLILPRLAEKSVLRTESSGDSRKMCVCVCRAHQVYVYVHIFVSLIVCVTLGWTLWLSLCNRHIMFWLHVRRNGLLSRPWWVLFNVWCCLCNAVWRDIRQNTFTGNHNVTRFWLHTYTSPQLHIGFTTNFRDQLPSKQQLRLFNQKPTGNRI